MKVNFINVNVPQTDPVDWAWDQNGLNYKLNQHVVGNLTPGINIMDFPGNVLIENMVQRNIQQ